MPGVCPPRLRHHPLQKLTTPSGFKLDMHINRRGDRYDGNATDPDGALCGGRPVLAEVFYTVDTDVRARSGYLTSNEPVMCPSTSVAAFRRRPPRPPWRRST